MWYDSLGVLLILLACRADGEESTQTQQLMTVSSETTYITEPLDKHGFPNYRTYLNKRFGEDVAPSQNSAVPLWSIIDEQSLDPDFKRELIRELKADPFLQDRPLLVTEDVFVEQESASLTEKSRPKDAREEIGRQLELAEGAGWQKHELAFAARWLEQNQAALSVAKEAVDRPDYFNPMVATATHQCLASIELPSLQKWRDIARLLAIRANLALAEGRLDDALSDTLIVHRLARHVGSGISLIELLVGLSLDARACSLERRLITHPKFDRNHLAVLKAEVSQLKKLPNAIETITLGDRLIGLSNLVLFAREMEGDIELTEEFSTIPYLFKWEDRDALRATLANKIDWDIVLREWNGFHNQLQAMTRENQLQQFRKIENDLPDLREWEANFQDPQIRLQMLIDERGTSSKLYGQLLMMLQLPNVEPTLTAEMRNAMRRTTLNVAMSLLKYKYDRGRYPRSLDELTPKYLEEVPQDVFGTGGLIYKSDGQSFTVYSVGMNGEDDGGYGYADEKRNAIGEPVDDLFVRTPNWGE